MKRDHTNTTQPQGSFSGGGGSTETGSSSCYTMAPENQDAGVDELLAAVGYTVKSSDLAEVAQKIKQLEEFVGNFQEEDGVGLSHLASDTVHYNPSDISSWLGSMISVASGSSTGTSLDNNNNNNNNNSSSSLVFDDSSFDSDSLTAIPGKAVYPPQPAVVVQPPPNKRMKPNPQLGIWGQQLPHLPLLENNNLTTRPVVLVVDSQENGIRLVHTLMACAEAIQQEDYKVAEKLVKQIGFLAVSQAGAMRKVATYFAEALAKRIYRLYPTNNPCDSAFTDLLQMHFYETCPYLKFAHFTANQAILEAFANKNRVHVIDFSMKQGMQWPALLQALALRPGGPPSFRLTGIGPPSHDNTDNLQEVGWKLAQLAETINVEFKFRGLVADSLADLDSSMFDIREGETIAVNSIFELHQLLARPGAIDKVLSVVRELKPELFTVVEQEANHNGPVFLDRFNESLYYYSTLFDSLEGCDNNGGEGGSGGGLGPSDQDKVMSEVYLGRQICNVVACEGIDRVERHETLNQWRTRFDSAGFEPVHLGSNAFKQASMLLALFAGGDGYRAEENNGCLMLGWHTRPLIATSAWKLS